MECREGTGRPDRAASLVGCTEGRQLPAGLPSSRIIRDVREKKMKRERNIAGVRDTSGDKRRKGDREGSESA